MNLERFIGFIFLVSIIFLIGIFSEPQSQYKNNIQISLPQETSMSFEDVNQDKTQEIRIEETPDLNIINPISNEPENIFFEKSDFDLFVYRAHVLSSEENAKKLSNKIKQGGFPSFVEPFGTNKNLYAIYIGPFLSESEISSNIEKIEEVSQSSQGEVTRWKL